MSDDLEVEAESDHVVRVRRDQFDLLMAALSAAEEDFRALCLVLGIDPGDAAPHDVMTQAVIPTVRKLCVTQQKVNSAEKDVLQAAGRFGHKTKDFGNGVQGVLVGKRDPHLLTGLQPATRRERREWERRTGKQWPS